MSDPLTWSNVTRTLDASHGALGAMQAEEERIMGQKISALKDAVELLRDAECILRGPARQGWHVRRQQILDMFPAATRPADGRYVITGADDGSGVAIVDVERRETVGTAATVDLAMAMVDVLHATHLDTYASEY